MKRSFLFGGVSLLAVGIISSFTANTRSSKVTDCFGTQINCANGGSYIACTPFKVGGGVLNHPACVRNIGGREFCYYTIEPTDPPCINQ